MQNKKTFRKIDQEFRESRSWLSRKVILVKKSKLINLKNLIILAFIAGAVIATIWIVDINRQTSSEAAVLSPACSGSAGGSCPLNTAGVNGSKCMLHTDCRSGRCAEFKCADKLVNGTKCNEIADCLSGRCATVLIGSRCEAKLSNGIRCVQATDCFSGKCGCTRWWCVKKCYSDGTNYSRGDDATGDTEARSATGLPK